MSNGSTSTAAVSRTLLHPKLDVLPAVQQIIRDRLDAQHARIFQIVNVIETLMAAINAKDENGEDSELTSIFGVLILAHDTLENIAEHIEPGSILSKEPTPSEQSAIARAAWKRGDTPATAAA